MQIRTRLTLQFIVVVGFIILFCFTAIYALLWQKRKTEFYTRLERKARKTASLLLNVEGIDSVKLRIIDLTGRDPKSAQNVLIYDNTARRIYRSNDSIDYFVTPQMIFKVMKVGRMQFEQGRFGILGFTFRGNDKRIVAVIAGDIDWESIQKNSFLVHLLSILYLLSIFIIAFAGRFFSRRALYPLSKVITQVNDLPIKSLEARLTISNTKDEIGQLTNTFNMLLDKIQNAFNLQKMFLSAASHEMKNPLTSITSQLQVLQFKPRTTEEYQVVVNSVLEDLVQLNKTTNDLIEFARLTYEINVDVSFEQVRIDDILWHCKEYYTKINPSNHVQLIFVNPPENQEELVISANVALLKIAFLNIIDNGCKFSENKTVVIRLSIATDTTEVSFTDTGIGMSASEQEHIFEPFYRTNNTSVAGGHGLGLAIVKKIADLHKASIELTSREQQGTCFALIFPRKKPL